MVFLPLLQGGGEPAGQVPRHLPEERLRREVRRHLHASGDGEDGPEQRLLGERQEGKAIFRGLCGGEAVGGRSDDGGEGQGQVLGLGWKGDSALRKGVNRVLERMVRRGELGLRRTVPCKAPLFLGGFLELRVLW